MSEPAAKIFHRLIVRYAVRHWFVLVLNILSLALGVGVYLAITLAGSSAERAFRASIDAVSGASHLEARSPSGHLPDSTYPALAADPLVAAATPVVEGYLTLPDHPGEYLHVVGVDLFTNAPFQTWRPVAADAGEADGDRPSLDLEAFLARPASLAVTESFARATGLAEGDTFRAQVDGAEATIAILEVVRFENAGSGGTERLALMDIGWAQELFAAAGRLTSVQIQLHDPSDLAAAATALARHVPADCRIATPEQRSQRIQRMIQGFQLNIRALSMVSILVGVFLIFNTVSASVVRRRGEIGTLRCLGASPFQIRALFLAEAALAGLLGILVGIPLGTLVADSLVGTISQTISVHYVLLKVGRATTDPSTIAGAALFGMVATLAGAWIPSREASRCDPVEALSPGRLFEAHRGRRARSAAIGIVFATGSVILSLASLATGPAWLSFLACLSVVVGFSFLVPAASIGVARLLAFVHRRFLHMVHGVGVVLALARDNFVRSLHRTTATIAALMAAIAMTVGVSVMVSSFRGTVARWIDASMVADIFVGPAANEVLGLQAHLPDSLAGDLLALDDVREVDTYLEHPVALADGNEYTIGVIDGPNRRNLRYVGGGDDAKSERFFARDDGVLVSEPLAAKLGLGEGDPIELPTPLGSARFTVCGVFHDYSDDHGRLTMRREVFDRWWDEPRIHSLAVYLAPDAVASRVAGTIRTGFSGAGELLVMSNRDLRERVFTIFDQTFAITYVLRTIAVLVAVLGIVLSLTTLATERARETAVFRSVGASRRQIGGTYLAESGAIGLVSALLGIACGLALAMILTWVVNKAFFGWTIEFRVPWRELLWAPVWVTLTAVLSGLLPAVRAGRLPLGATLRRDA